MHIAATQTGSYLTKKINRRIVRLGQSIKLNKQEYDLSITSFDNPADLSSDGCNCCPCSVRLVSDPDRWLNAIFRYSDIWIDGIIKYNDLFQILIVYFSKILPIR